MSVIGVGTDLVEVARFRTAIERTASLPQRLFSEAERAYASDQHDPAKSLAARFAAKEALMKALGVGLGDIDFHDVEVVREEGGAPTLVVRGRAETLASERGVTRWLLSMSHTDSTAMAVVIAVAG
ncbi:MAG TPA: holo-ACP synthase [Acidimicrobiia bacterium]|nr:holo-ACP synthase [Acidimicrobiia bacterium]